MTNNKVIDREEIIAQTTRHPVDTVLCTVQYGVTAQCTVLLYITQLAWVKHSFIHLSPLGRLIDKKEKTDRKQEQRREAGVRREIEIRDRERF